MPKLALVLLFLAHLATPFASVLIFGAPPIWLLGGLTTAFAVSLSLLNEPTFLLRLLVALFSSIALAISLLVSASYYVQGQGVNSELMYHLDVATLDIAAKAYGDWLFPALGVLIMSFILPFAASGRSIGARLAGLTPIIWLVAVFTNYPAYSFVQYFAGAVETNATDFSANYADPAAVLEYLREGADNRDFSRRKNLILIYAESLEQTYFDQGLFQVDLLPNLRRLSKRATRFTNLVQLPGASATISGIVASQCGFPISTTTTLANNTSPASVEDPYSDENCLGDVLSGHGYNSIFLGGADHAFAGKGEFLQTHGYERVYGLRELEAFVDDPSYRHEWGLYDDSLFDIAREQIVSLEGEDAPYLLTLLTVDTHHPNGFLSRSCDPLDASTQAMMNAIYCSDQLISTFISDVMGTVDMDNTVIALFSDHLSMRNTLWDKLQSAKDARRLNFTLFDNRPPKVIDLYGTHFDVAPTLLESLGFPGKLQLGNGTSLFFKNHMARLGQPLELRSSIAPELISADSSALTSGAVIRRSNLSISVGDASFKASANGGPFESGMYLVVLDGDGFPVDAVYSQDYATLAEKLEGRFVIGISVFDNRPDRPSYFYGSISWDGSGIVQRPLYGEVDLAPDDLNSKFKRVGRPERTANNYFVAQRVAHAGGGLGKKRYTNSYEALDRNLSRGFRYFELDLNFTSDGELVCIHDWGETFSRTFGQRVSEAPTLREFKALAEAHTEYRSCTLSGLGNWMEMNPAAYIITDVKENNLSALAQVIEKLPDADKRVIPQIYHPSEYDVVREMGYENLILTLYKYEGSPGSILTSIKDWSGNFAITMPKTWAATGFPAHLQTLGVPTYTHTINDIEEAAELTAAYAITEIYTDFLVP